MINKSTGWQLASFLLLILVQNDMLTKLFIVLAKLGTYLA
jgi:hypothetical protein